MVTVSVCIVTFNSERTLAACLASVLGQSVPFHEVRVLDNASADGTVAVLEAHSSLAWGRAPVNTGFAAGFNALVRETTGEWLLLLNPDARLPLDFHAGAQAVLERCAGHPVGMVSPKLLRAAGDSLEPLPVLDSAGIEWSLLFRHRDRGSSAPDRGQFDGPGLVFGVTGAAALYRRLALADAALEGEVLDERFFAYREDADLAFRLQWRGWDCLYEPSLVAWHERRVLPERRRALPPELNFHSLKNRYLLLGKDVNALLGAVLLPFLLPYEAAILLYCLLFERTSLRAYASAWAALPSTRRWRRHTLGRKKIPAWGILSRFLCPKRRSPF
jgi:GT2 family glycosyltransferase